MHLLLTRYGLSDYGVEDRVNDSLSFSRFVGLRLQEKAPDHSVISRFRTELTVKGAYEELFKELNRQLSMHGILINQGVIVDASITETPLRPKEKTTYAIVEDRSNLPRDEQQAKQEEQAHRLIKKKQPGVDHEARWVKKAGKLHYGYKKPMVTDTQGMVLAVATTPAKVHETSNMEDVLAKAHLSEKVRVYADKGYASKQNRAMLKAKKLKDWIQKKAVRGKALTRREVFFNQLISKIRYRVERTFGGIKRWFHSLACRYRGLEKAIRSI